MKILAKNSIEKLILLTFLSSLVCHAFAGDKNNNDSNEGFTYKLSAKAQLRSDNYDSVFSANGEQETDYYLRRAEAGVAGQFVKSFNYKLKLKADNDGDVTVRDAYLAYDLPYKSEVLAGRFDPDFGLELSGSNSWTTAIERSSIWDLVKNAGDGSDGAGMAVRTAHKHYFVSLGGFDFSDSKVLNMRLAYIPLNSRQQILHLGYSVRNAQYDNPDSGRVRTDLGVWGVHVNNNGNSIRLARDSRAYGFDDDFTQALELAYAYGAFSIQGEHLDRHFNGARNEHDRDATGDYVQIAYTITGESRNYDSDSATFGKIKSQRSYGAWEIFYRYDTLAIDGEVGLLTRSRTHSEATAKVMGINWYALDYLKISANYISGAAPLIPNDVGDEKGNAYSLQAQIKF